MKDTEQIKTWFNNIRDIVGDKWDDTDEDVMDTILTKLNALDGYYSAIEEILDVYGYFPPHSHGRGGLM